MVIVGGGVIGMAVAWRARQRGMSVIGARARRARAGHLARGSRHAGAGGGGGVRRGRATRLLELGLRSRGCGPRSPPSWRRSPARCRPHGRTGTLLAARDQDDARELERQLDFRQLARAGRARLRPSEAREREPALTPTVRLCAGGALTTTPSIRVLVLPRCVWRAIATGVQLRELRGRRARRARRRRAHRRRATLDGERRARRRGRARGRPVERADRGAAPRRARARASGQGPDPAPARPRRTGTADGAWCASRDGYLVPREDGRYVLGATVEERGFGLGRPPVACTSCCATRASWCRASASWRSKSCRLACARALRQRPRDRPRDGWTG